MGYIDWSSRSKAGVQGYSGASTNISEVGSQHSGLTATSSARSAGRHYKLSSSISNPRRRSEIKTDTTPSFVIELRLKTSVSEETEIDKSFNAGRMIYNACLGETLRRVDLMRESKAYKKVLAMPQDADRTKAFKSLRQQYGFKDSAIQAF